MFTELTSSDNHMNHTHYHYEGKWALVTGHPLESAEPLLTSSLHAEPISFCAPEGQKRFPISFARIQLCAV